MVGKIYKVVYFFLGAGIVFAIVVLGLYFYTFQGDLSRDPKEWESFGALLGGVFTLCSALATIGALLFVNKENAENRSVIEQQTQALAFEQYVKHRELFIKVLTDAARDCSRDIEPYRMDELYKKIFPRNNPTRTPEYAVELRGSKGNDPGSLSDMVSAYKELGKQLESFDASCALHLLRMMDLLHIKSTESPKNGDLIFFDENTGINIYDLRSKVDEIFRLLNAVLFFTGNPGVENLDHHANSGLLKPKLIRHYAKGQDEVYAKKEGALQKKLEDIYLFFSDNEIPMGHFEETNRRIRQGFSDRGEVANLLDNVKPFIKCYQQECLKIENDKKELSDEGKGFAVSARSKLNSIIAIYQLDGALS